MPRAPAGREKRLDWSPRARASFRETLAYVAGQDPFSAEQIKDRVEAALKHVLAFPAIGTPAAKRGVRRLPIPSTGHVLDYRVSASAIRVLAWYRARRRPR